jgi:hypothetical protein
VSERRLHHLDVGDIERDRDVVMPAFRDVVGDVAGGQRLQGCLAPVLSFSQPSMFWTPCVKMTFGIATPST